MIPVETDKMRILWPDAVGNDKLLHVDVYEAGVLELFLQLGPGPDLVAGFLERAVDFVIVPFYLGAVVTAVFRGLEAVQSWNATQPPGLIDASSVRKRKKRNR